MPLFPSLAANNCFPFRTHSLATQRWLFALLFGLSIGELSKPCDELVGNFPIGNCCRPGYSAELRWPVSWHLKMPGIRGGQFSLPTMATSESFKNALSGAPPILTAQSASTRPRFFPALTVGGKNYCRRSSGHAVSENVARTNCL